MRAQEAKRASRDSKVADCYMNLVAITERVSLLDRKIVELSSEIRERKSNARWLIGIALSTSLGLFAVIVILMLKLMETSV